MDFLPIVNDNHPPQFPATSEAMSEPNGLLATGGDLSVDRILCAYKLGIFPWPMDDNLLWWSPEPRMVIYPNEMKISKSLKKSIARTNYKVSINQNFIDVINLCANNRFRSDTWITRSICSAYINLHKLGYAHSVEIIVDGELAGGLYGLLIGSVFFGESMFHLQPDCAKIALHELCKRSLEKGVKIIDCQVESPFLATLGAKPIKRACFESILKELIDKKSKFSQTT